MFKTRKDWDRVVDEHRAKGLLLDMKEDEKADAEVIVCCVDGFHFCDVFKHVAARADKVHPITVAGGAIVLDPEFEYPEILVRAYGFPPAAYVRAQVIAQIRHGMDHLQTNKVRLESHGVCGVVDAHAWEQIGRTYACHLRGRAYLRQQIPGIEEECTFHYVYERHLGRRTTKMNADLIWEEIMRDTYDAKTMAS